MRSMRCLFATLLNQPNHCPLPYPCNCSINYLPIAINIQYIFYISMQFEASMLMPERTRPSRQEIVIILSDNRLNNSPNVSSFDFRNSAYKGTQADAVDSVSNDALFSPPLFTATNLIERVTALENKVDRLFKLENELRGGKSGNKKQRRRFAEIERINECRLCHKAYGSETALKNHQKIKHDMAREQPL